MMGSPMVRFRSTVQGRLKSLAVMNLKILFTLMLCVALEKKRVAFIALAYARACSQRKKNWSVTESTEQTCSCTLHEKTDGTT
jgi:hypothetical protein